MQNQGRISALGASRRRETLFRTLPYGYGQRTGAEYKPWLRVRDAQSKGRCGRPPRYHQNFPFASVVALARAFISADLARTGGCATSYSLVEKAEKASMTRPE